MDNTTRKKFQSQDNVQNDTEVVIKATTLHYRSTAAHTAFSDKKLHYTLKCYYFFIENF